MPDQYLKQTVLDELKWEPTVNAAHIGVTARDGIITLTGHVESYDQKWAAEQAAERVAGVKAIVEELEVRYATELGEGDEEVVKRAMQVLAWDVGVPHDRLKVKVEKGWVTLSGHVDWYYQKHNAESSVRRLHGVLGVINSIMIEPAVEAQDVSKKIDTALRRTAFFNHDQVAVASEGGQVTLHGHVDNYYERSLAGSTAWSAPGVIAVDNQLIVDDQRVRL
jgi:osmotically-inducible protein OsmY